jgi:elongation factor Ts
VIGVLVAFDGPPPAEIGRQIAMHVAASDPKWVTEGDIPAAVLAEKQAELLAQARTTGKPAAVVERMVDGRLQKFVGEAVLLRQPFIINPDATVEQALAAVSVGVSAFLRFRVGSAVEP